jgi:hypothetical protein
LRILSLEVYPKMNKKYTRKPRFEYWTTEIDPMENKLKDKKYRGHDKSCPRMENHANGTAHFLCLLDMICRGLYIFCLLACFKWDLFWLTNFQIRIFLSIFHVIIIALLMVVLPCFNSILVKS